MMKDAFANAFDTALLVSADSDLVPAVTAIRGLFPEKSIVVAFPPERFSAELKGAAHASFTIGRAKLAACQLPDPVLKADGTQLARPAKWCDAPQTQFGATLKSALDEDRQPPLLPANRRQKPRVRAFELAHDLQPALVPQQPAERVWRVGVLKVQADVLAALHGDLAAGHRRRQVLLGAEVARDQVQARVPVVAPRHGPVGIA